MPAALCHLMNQLEDLVLDEADDLSPRELWALGETLAILEEGAS